MFKWRTRLSPLACAVALVAVDPPPEARADEAPGASGHVDPAPTELWQEATRAEDERRFLETGRAYERIARLAPEDSRAWWRAARGYWLAADELPQEDKSGRIRGFQRAQELATVGIAADPECAECMLWKFSSMGRLRTSIGVWQGIRQLPEMAELLDAAIALDPTWADGPDNSTLGNLHYASAIFYRIVPDWFWVRWFIGIRGDKQRALRHIETALALHPDRLDYRVELAAQHLCLGSARKEASRLDEGAALARSAIASPAHTADDEREIAAARIMLAEPAKACGYSGDAWIELDESGARSVATK